MPGGWFTCKCPPCACSRKNSLSKYVAHVPQARGLEWQVFKRPWMKNVLGSTVRGERKKHKMDKAGPGNSAQRTRPRFRCSTLHRHVLRARCPMPVLCAWWPGYRLCSLSPGAPGASSIPSVRCPPGSRSLMPHGSETSHRSVPSSQRPRALRL